MKTVRYHIEIDPKTAQNSIGLVAQSYAAPNGCVISTTSLFNGKHDLAVIEIPTSDVEFLEGNLDKDDSVVAYR